MRSSPVPGSGSVLDLPGAFLLVCVALLLACGGDEGTAPDVDVASIDVTATRDTLTAIGDTVVLAATARNASGEVLPGVAFSWTSSAPTTVSVAGSTGLATAEGAGAATVTASAGGVSGSVEVHVVQVVVSVVVTPAEWSPTWIGARTRLTAEPRDANGHPVAEGGPLVWTSGNTAIATVDTTGTATARGVGTTQITAELEVNEGTPPAGSTAVSVTDAGSGSVPDGLVYTVYPARWDTFPALLVDGRLTFTSKGDELYRIPPYAVRGDYCCDAVWTEANVSKFEFNNRRIGLLTDVVDGRGNLRVKGPYEEWTVLQYGDAIDFDLSGNRIGVLYGPGALRVKEGIHGAWTDLASSGVVDFRLEGNHIAVLRDDGSFYAKEGITGPWALLATGGTRQYVLSGSWIGLLLEDGSLRLKQGVNGPWTVVASSGIEQFDMAGDRIVALRDDGALLGKESVNAGWVTLTMAGLRHFEIERDRVAVIRDDGQFLAKDGMNSPWSMMTSQPTSQIRLDGDFIIWLGEDNRVGVKQGLNGAWRRTAGPVASGTVTQLDPIVRRPVPPVRMTPADHAVMQDDCIHNGGGLECYAWITDTWRLAPYYGRFCGGGRPADSSWDSAVNYGPMDPLDYLCLHHDNAPAWYAWDNSTTHQCVVNHGLYHSRLTRDGAVLAVGSHYETDLNRWDSAWDGQMGNLKTAVEVYYDKTGTCDLANYEGNIP